MLPIKRILEVWVVGAATLAVLPASGEDMAPQTDFGVPASVVVLPGTQYVIAPGRFTIGPKLDHSLQDLMKAIEVWLSFEFDLPAIDDPPAVAFASARRMISLRRRDVPSYHWAGIEADIVAVYDDDAKTIYLPEGWSGRSAAELSVLVHEMVHHIQNIAGLKFACPEERERTAFDAQERWLGLFGNDLSAEFGLDPFTLLVRTNCPY